jgi:hypothetical protein
MTTAADTMAAKTEKARRLRAALLSDVPGAEITESVLMEGAPGNEQIVLHVAIPGLTHGEVMPRMRAFQRARWDDLLADIGDDVCIVSEGPR